MEDKMIYKEIQLKISENAINEMQSQLVTAGLCVRPLSASEQAMYLILKAMSEDKVSATIELKDDLKKAKKKKVRKKRKTK